METLDRIAAGYPELFEQRSGFSLKPYPSRAVNTEKEMICSLKF